MFGSLKELAINKSEVPSCKDMSEKGQSQHRKVGVEKWKYMPIFAIALYLSNKCTRQCSYCYSGSGEKMSNEMTDSNFDRLLEFIQELYWAGDKAVFQLTHLGGEPLLRTDRVRRLQEAAKKTNGMIGVLFTNGDLLNTIEWEDVQDITVWALNITDLPLNEIERRMTLIRKNSRAFNQTLAATLDGVNLEGTRMEDVVRFGLENKYRFRFTQNIWKTNDEDYKKRLLAKTHSIVDVCEEYHAKGYAIPTSYILDRVLPYHWWKLDTPYENFTPYPCGRGICSVNYDGSISPCLRNQNIKIADIFSSENIIQKLKVPEWEYSFANKFIDKECLACEVRYVCQGGCPNDKVMSCGSVSGKAPFCQISKEIIPRLLPLVDGKRWQIG